MKSIKKNLLVLATALPTLFYAQDWYNSSNPATPNGNLYRVGKIALGNWYFPDQPGQSGQPGPAWYGNQPGPQIDVWAQNSLGTGINSYLLMSSFSGATGVVNNSSWIRNNLWLIRRGTNNNNADNIGLHDGISINSNNTTPGVDTRTYWERDASGDIQSWGTGSATYMTLKAGSLGIGTSNPGSKLDVRDANHSMIVALTNGANKPASLWTSNTTTNYGFMMDASNIGRIVQNSANLKNLISFTFNTNLTTPRAQVWIGAMKQIGTHSDFALSVDGKLLSRDIIVTQANWSDFVFDKDYKLMPLNELEKFYKEKHHLPDVPSANEITSNGNNMAQTDAVLLQKIEELTLYIVELAERLSKIEKSVICVDSYIIY